MEVDQPIAVTRYRYTDFFYPNPYTDFAPSTYSLYWSPVAQMALATCVDGLVNFAGGNTYMRFEYPHALFAYDRAKLFPLEFQGTLILDKEDAAQTLYRRNRVYDPTTGRFTQEDPIGLAGGLNAYGFASGDPVNFGDPFGLCSTPPDSILVTVTVECGDGTTGTRQVWAHRVTDPQTLDNYAVSANGITMDAEDDYDPALLGETGELILGALGAVYEIPERVDAYHVATAGGVPRGETSTMFLRSDVLRNIRNGSYGAFIQGNPRLQTCQIVFHEGLHMWFNSKGFFGPDDDHPMINPLVARTRC